MKRNPIATSWKIRFECSEFLGFADWGLRALDF